MDMFLYLSDFKKKGMGLVARLFYLLWKTCNIPDSWNVYRLVFLIEQFNLILFEKCNIMGMGTSFPMLFKQLLYNASKGMVDNIWSSTGQHVLCEYVKLTPQKSSDVLFNDTF